MFSVSSWRYYIQILYLHGSMFSPNPDSPPLTVQSCHKQHFLQYASPLGPSDTLKLLPLPGFELG